MENMMDKATAAKLVALTTDLMMVLGRMKRAAPEREVGPVHPGTSFAILDTILRHDCRTVPEIATWRGVTRQSIQGVVNKLIDMEILAYSDNPSHKSSRHLRATPGGMEIYNNVKDTMLARYAQSTSSLRPGDIEAAARVMAVIAETWNLGDQEDLARSKLA